MATVNQSKRTPGRWVLTYQADRKQHIRTFHSKKAADKARREIEHEIDMGIHAADADSKPFGDVARAFLIDCQRRQRIGDNMGAYALHAYTDKVERYMLPYLEKTPLSDLNKNNHAFRKWIDELREHYAPNTVQGAYQTAFGIMSFAVSQGWIKRNILRDDPLKNLPRLTKRKKIPSTESWQRLVNAAEHQARSENLLTFLNRRLCVYLGGHGGMRPGEWFGLQWESLDFANNKIRIEHSFNKFDGLKGPKTEAGRRAFDFTDQIYAASNDLALYWTLRDKLSCEPGWRSYRPKTISLRIQDAWAKRGDMQIDIPPRTGHVILSKSLQPMRTNACVWFWGGLMRKAGLVDEDGKNDFSPHALRHFNASYQLANGANPLATSRRIGHSRASTTLDDYGHVLPGDDSANQAVTKMSQTFAPQLLPPPDLPADNRERKLTEDQVREIRALIADDVALTRIAKDMKISLSSVHGIKSGRNWAWLA